MADTNEWGALAALELPPGPKYQDDMAGQRGCVPIAVYAPRNAAECALVLRAMQRAARPAVVQGGRTGLSGGGRIQPGEVVLSLERARAAPRIDPLAATMTLGAGITLQEAQEAAAEAGFYLAADLGARGSATIGGMISTNAGGPLALRYGSFRQQVLGVEAVMADGTIIDRLNGLAKDNSGYDLSQWLIGSEGTLGVVMRACLRLHAMPRTHRVAVCAVSDVAAALALLQHLRSGLGPMMSGCELIAEPLLSETCAHLALRYPFAVRAPAAVLVEMRAMNPEADDALFNTVLEAALQQGLIADAVLSTSDRDIAGFWGLRDGCSTYLFSLSQLVSLDLSLPIGAIPGFLDRAARLPGPDNRAFVFGHLGDGNLHYCLTGAVEDGLLKDLFTLLASVGGSITAEHGIGLDKVGYLGLCRSAAEITLMRHLKSALDPAGILNPGRIFAPAENP